MPSLINNKEIFSSFTDPNVVSPNLPGGDVGISKTIGEKGFFIKSKTIFTLWFKDGSGVWNLFNNNATTGTFQWGANQSFYIQSDSEDRFFVFRRMEASAPMAVVQRGDKTNRPRIFDPPTSHSRLGSTWTTSGHTGEPYSIGLFGISGAGGFLSAPISGQREGKFLGWDENGDMGWITPVVVAADVMGEAAGIENTATLNGGAYFSNTGAVILDGVDDYVQTDSNYHYPDQFQLGVYIKPTGLDNDFQTIAGTRNYDGSANGFILQIKDGVIRATGPQSDNFVLDAPIPAGVNLEDGEYHEIKLKWVKDDELTIFLDGEKIGTHVPAGVVRGGTEDMEIGRNPKNQNMHFEGEIDGVSVTNEVQTEEEILNEFIAKVLGNTPSPVDYDGIEDLGTTTMVNDASLVNGYLTLDGSNYAQADSNHHYGDYLTATAWFRTVKHESDYGVLFSSRKWNGSGNGFALAIKNNAVHLHHPQTNNTHVETTFGHVELSDGGWHQVVLRWQANTDLSAFVDGVKVDSLVPAGGINAGVWDLVLGSEPHNWTGKFIGHIDGVKVENVYKSDNEIMAEFTGVPLMTLLGSNPLGLFAAPYTDPGATAIDHPDGDLTAQITSDWNTVVGASPAMGDYTVIYSVTDSDGNISNLTRAVTVGDGLEDIATLANNATRPDGVLVTNGVSQYGYLPTSTDYDLDGGDMTVRCWFKTDTAIGSGRSLVTKGIGSPTWKGWGIYLHDAGGLAFNLWSSDVGGGNRSNLFGSPSDWNVGEWNHIAVVMSTANPYKAYVNGQLIAEFTPNSKSSTTDSNLNIGTTQLTNNQQPGYFFDGQVKKALIAKSALSAAEILAEYNLGSPPELTLLGNNPYFLDSLDDTDPGATAVDALDGNVTANIVSDWDTVVDEGLAGGIHNIVYSITDSHGNSRSATREVWNGTIEDWSSTALNGDAARTAGDLVLSGNGYAVAASNHHYADHFYFESWFKTDSLQNCTSVNNWTNMVVLASSRKWNGSWNGFTIAMATGHINIHHPSNNVVAQHDLAGYVINDNEWHHIGLQWIHNGALVLYVDGQKRETWTANGTAKQGSVGLNLGRDPYSGNLRYTGQINNVTIRNQIMSDADVLALYNANAPATITLLGDSPMNVTTLPASDPGATAEDPDTGNITANIVSDWNAVVGANPNNDSYTVTYTVTSSRGDVVTKTRSVEVAVVAVYPDSPFIEEWPFRATPIGSVTGILALNDAEKILDGNGTVTIPASEFSHITDEYTISFWFKNLGGASGTHFDSAGLKIWGWHSGGSVMSIKTGLFNPTIKSEGFFNSGNAWVHACITVSTDENDVCTTTIYKNGVKFVNAIDANPQTHGKVNDVNWTGDFVLSPAGAMQLDSVELVDYASSPTGVANLYSAGRGTSMNEVLQSTPPVVYNLTHEPILASPGASAWYQHRTDTDLYNWSTWLGTQHCPLPNPCNDKYTLSIWFKVLDGFGPLILSNYDSNTDGFRLEVHDDYFLYGTSGGGDPNYDWPIDKNTSFADGEWHHVAATFDHAAGTRTLHLDGAKLTGGDDTFTPNSGSPDNKHFLFYRKFGGPQFYNYQGAQSTKKFGNVHLVNQVLSDPHINDIYNAGHLGIIIEISDVPDAPVCYVEDVEDGDGVITATSNWDTVIGPNPTAGIHTVTYSATDSHGETTDLDVSVVVVAE